MADLDEAEKQIAAVALLAMRAECPADELEGLDVLMTSIVAKLGLAATIRAIAEQAQAAR